jgi:hypothetical protein
MKLSKEVKTENEIDDFVNKFYGKKNYMELKAINGKIVSCETTDKDIKDYLKKLGLK